MEAELLRCLYFGGGRKGLGKGFLYCARDFGLRGFANWSFIIYVGEPDPSERLLSKPLAGYIGNCLID